ncbi:hypothetical protein GKR41_00424 [Candidatus Vallotia lariciata]|nr:hypothetical protein GKR41_00424 [Candidatus Vallotia lariciata]
MIGKSLKLTFVVTLNPYAYFAHVAQQFSAAAALL